MPSLPHSNPVRRSPQAVARGLGWFSIAFGIVELTMTRSVARAVGMQGREGQIRLHGLRELVTGIGLVSAADPAPWMAARVAGGGVHIATLSARMIGAETPYRTALATAGVTAMTVLDVATTVSLKNTARHDVARQFDYSDRSGFPSLPDAMRGRARQNFVIPPDMAIPAALRPLV